MTAPYPIPDPYEPAVTVWTCSVPLPPSYLMPNQPTAHIGTRMAKADAEKRYKAICAPILAECSIRHAKHVRVSLVWYSVRNEAYKAKPGPRGRVTKAAIKNQPYYCQDVSNAAAATKYLIDAMEQVGIVPKDKFQYVSFGSITGMMTPECRKFGVTEPHIAVTLEIEEEQCLNL